MIPGFEKSQLKVLSNLDSYASSLQQWHRSKFGNFKKEIFDVQKKVIATITTTISHEINASLLLPFTAAKVVNALQTMCHDKSPESDGMSAMFYQNYWPIVGNIVTDVVLEILNDGQSIELINTAVITLIHKIKKPQARGLRQWDPLSPYLFLICSEGLSRMLQYEEAAGNLQGLRLTRHASSVSHLLFTDDSPLFCETTNASTLTIKRVLNLYHRALGQMLNNQKSIMSFSPNTPKAAKHFFNQTLNMPTSECHERYLGLPSYSGRDKKELFSNIKECIWKLMHAWNEKLFSVGGNEVLLKTFVQSIPTYAMSCFRLT
uniref:Reverse transcriptase domain-containing protein n=1 Tax=Cannabis sativa TaxID=3483 RepID=A0A803PL55_CANSA